MPLSFWSDIVLIPPLEFILHLLWLRLVYPTLPCVPVCYINPPANTPSNQLKPYTTLTLIQPIVPTPASSLVHHQPQ